jgi:cellulose synthase/poly-beta-1,6-N-acetylglucosamine synthase-like glycosyltransferase
MYSLLLFFLSFRIFIFAFLLVYALCLLFIFLYSLSQAGLVYQYLIAKKDIRKKPLPLSEGALPLVTIQLPLYNETYVVERLIDAICTIHYSWSKLEIQVLDDSTDDTVDKAEKKIKYWANKGINIHHIRRKDRKDFKAGALKEGLALAKGDFIAIFDADFIPDKDFLQKTLPYFTSPTIGMVQTRWQHLNESYSLLTRLQAFGLDAHFTVEQSGRNKGNYFINFNGTAGIWRKDCILDAGNWHADTLTEDLDLSYRAQLKGWEFVYCENIHSPAELPPVMGALKTQQYRWSKGGAEVARKHLRKVWGSKNSFFVKWHATFHLLNSFVFVCISLAGLFSLPLLLLKHHFTENKYSWFLSSGSLLSFLILGCMYWVASQSKTKTLMGKVYFFRIYPIFLSVMLGLSLHNALAVLEGLMGKKTPFVRTPKFNINTKKDTWKGKKYRPSGLTMMTVVEGLLALYFFFGCLMSFHLKDYGLLPFHLMLCYGFSTVFYFSVFQSHEVKTNSIK